MVKLKASTHLVIRLLKPTDWDVTEYMNYIAEDVVYIKGEIESKSITKDNAEKLLLSTYSISYNHPRPGLGVFIRESHGVYKLIGHVELNKQGKTLSVSTMMSCGLNKPSFYLDNGLYVELLDNFHKWCKMLLRRRRIVHDITLSMELFWNKSNSCA